MSGLGLLGGIRGWMNEGPGRWVCIVLAAAGIVAAGAIFLAGGSDEADGVLRAGLHAEYLCTKCNAFDKVRLSFKSGEDVNFASKFPMDCPKCEASDAAVLAVKCLGCARPMPIPNEPIYYCPHPDCRKKYDNTEQRE